MSDKINGREFLLAFFYNEQLLVHWRNFDRLNIAGSLLNQRRDHYFSVKTVT